MDRQTLIKTAAAVMDSYITHVVDKWMRRAGAGPVEGSEEHPEAYKSKRTTKQ